MVSFLKGVFRTLLYPFCTQSPYDAHLRLEKSQHDNQRLSEQLEELRGTVKVLEDTIKDLDFDLGELMAGLRST
ncbi:hypothetical protein AAF712_015710 [Marasmius tenuissimus]|uniref:Uncharacterized protein n=1 Tax=Marasmius tenuissimus TaxID=585030 RepID=A0ABR2Z9I3_9AGAR